MQSPPPSDLTLPDILKDLQERRITPETAKRRIAELRARTSTARPEAATTATPGTRQAPEPIAIIGMSGRYPDAANLSQFWENLAAGKLSVREIPKSRWDVDQFFDPEPGKPGKTYCKWLGLLDDV
jgi:hypothetical protein